MLNSVLPFATVVKIEPIQASASSSLSAQSVPGIKITCLILPEYVSRINGKAKFFYLLTKSLRHHLGDVVFDYSPEQIDYRQRKNYFVMTMIAKGAIKAVCQAIVRASQAPTTGYGGLLVGPELEKTASEILNSLPGSDTEHIEQSDSHQKTILVDGEPLKQFHSSSSPGLFDFGDRGKWVVKTNMGSARRSVLAQVGIDKMLKVLVNPAFPETMVFYDTAGNRQGYASRFMEFETLRDYLRTIRTTPGKVADFLADNAYVIGQLSAQAIFTGNVDVLTANIAVANHKVIGLFDNDRTVMEYLGKYHGYADSLDNLFFSPPNQSDLRSPFNPINMFTQAWFYRYPHASTLGIMPPTIEREYYLPGLHQLMKENQSFKIGYFQTLYAFSRLQPIHFESFFSVETKVKRKTKLIAIFTQRANQLATDLWAWSDFYESYHANPSLFEDHVCAMPLGHAPIHALSHQEIEELTKASINAKAIESGDRAKLEAYLSRLDQREDDSYLNNFRTNNSKRYGLAKQIRYLDLERLKISDLLTQSRVRLDKKLGALLEEQIGWISAKIDSHYEALNDKLTPFLTKDPLQLFINYLNAVLENNSIDYAELIRQVDILKESLSDFQHSLILLDILQSDDLFSMIDKGKTINHKIEKLLEKFDPCPATLWSINPKDINTLAECDEAIARSERALEIFIMLEDLLSIRLIAKDSLQDLKARMNREDNLKGLIQIFSMKRAQMNLESILTSSTLSVEDTIVALNHERFAFYQPMQAPLLNHFWAFFNTHALRSHEVLDPLFKLPKQIHDLDRDGRIACLKEALVIIDTQLKINNGLSTLLHKLQLTYKLKENLVGLSNRPINSKDLERLLLSLRSSLNLEVFSNSYEHYQQDHAKTNTSQAGSSFFQRDKALFGNVKSILRKYAKHKLEAIDAWDKINQIARHAYSFKSEFFQRAFKDYKPNELWQPPIEIAPSESSTALVIK